MENMNNCSFCAELNQQQENNLFLEKIKPYIPIENRIIFRTENWVVMPTIGSLVSGYLLLVSKDHYISVGSCPTQMFFELTCLIKSLRQVLFNIYKTPVIVFEHGGSSTNFKGGCCVDHTHLHILPFKCDIINNVNNQNLRKHVVTSFSDLRNYFLKGVPYLYYENHNEKKVAITGEIIVSQYFRKIISHELNIPEKWDWRYNTGMENIVDTLVKIDSNEIERVFNEVITGSITPND